MSARTATVLPGQTLPDIAVQHCGSLSAWPGLASLNGLAMTAPIDPGAVLLLPDTVDKRTAAFFTSGGYRPAAGEIVAYGGGIGWWVIENDLIVQ